MMPLVSVSLFFSLFFLSLVPLTLLLVRGDKNALPPIFFHISSKELAESS